MYRNAKAFTLAEMLIVVAILVIVLVFIIPKLFNSVGQSQTDKSKAYEITGILSGAIYSYYAANKTYSPSNHITATTLFQYINYVRLMPTGYQIDNIPNFGLAHFTCASDNCWLLHNGSILAVENPAWGPCGSQHIQAMRVWFDPDGKLTSTANTQADPKSVRLYLHSNGRVHLEDRESNPSCACGACATPDPSRVPDWIR